MQNCTLPFFFRKAFYMDLKPTFGIGDESSALTVRHEFWPVEEINPKNAKFPCCLVWTPLPVVSWLAPFIGHVGICKEDGSIIDFSGSNLLNVDDFAYGSVARYIQLDREKCCFPPNLAAHTCKHRYSHTQYGSTMTWDDAIQSSVRQFEHKSYNLFTCNCHSFVANCLNRLCYDDSLSWNMINVAALLLFKGQWVDTLSVVRSFFPVILMLCLGVSVVGWPFLIGLISFSVLLMCWFVLGTYYVKSLFEC
ncbi:protein REVERSION-TO-ETHYLENE SENSITIVITY1 isoform X2 [Daucus carota subsp. sativus]|uniref:protein REVERSION-TO-ETHYLENE SENSITIVITY1 isoform X2 n=1 Tax=Daucus carota subsp. sativus TaxID=79200 RepID=UPI0007EF18AE|nr:PREDICTED: protein REVERSION-TO-ETHYLENE SENSITIVITY1 isoform X2 [Daucus carota subsp. sativus]